MRLAGKVAIITGAGAGIGRATALLFAREGAEVVVADCDPEKGAETVSLIKENGGAAIFVQVDVSKAADVKKMVKTSVERYGKLDILINNAGIYAQADVVEAAEEEWDRLLDVNLKGVFLCSKYSIPEMIKGGGGTIVNIGSEAGIVGIKNQVAYNVSKSGVIALTKSMAIDFAAHNIRVNCVCPGTTETPLVKAALERAPDPAAARRALEEVRPANRLGRPEEIAAGILYLASDESLYATGSILSIDGGYTAQ
ncbi:MAG TPA: short-chain dehydrogenase [Chloroflexi bacterium]|nr:short-chain dehydrogenase [Chloroflexota bacterium]